MTSRGIADLGMKFSGLLVSFFAAANASDAFATPARFWEPLEPGQYSVGFRLMAETDKSRPALPPATGTGRQIPIAVWYPANAAPKTPLRIRDYVLASEQAIIGSAPENAEAVVETFAKPRLENGAAKPDLDRLLDTATIAGRDSAPSPGRFPLVLFAHSTPEDESVTCEYLASHGYVVAAVRSRAASDVTYKLSRENLDAMVADHAFAAERMRREPNVSDGPIGVIGMSNGSIAALALQLRGVKAGALVSLDGGIGENAGGTFLKERSDGNVSKFKAPVLHFYAPNNPHLNLDHLKSYNGCDRTLIFVRGMRHGDFLANPMFDRIAPHYSGADATADALPGFIWVNRYTLKFLDANLRGDSAAARWLAQSPETHAVPAGLFTIENLKPQPDPK